MNLGNNKCFFVEGATGNDVVGFQSYVNSLENAIKSGAKFLGVISDFGTGKSSLIKMLDNKLNGDYKIITINLWNCENNEDDTISIHQMFLYQLIEELNISPKNYYKNKVNKNYRIFDINFKNSNLFYIGSLMSFYILLLFDKLKMLSLFICDLQKFITYVLISILTVLCIMFYKPLFSFSKDDTSRNIDENDTKDLYNNILAKYFKKSFFKKKHPLPLIISLEEIDRYNRYDDVIKYLKEFYKFYKLTNYEVIFITSIKPASKMIPKNSSNENSLSTKDIKGVYEKIFDYILNLNRINIHDYGSILVDIINRDYICLPEGIDYPNLKTVEKWRYLYQGEKITIRDIKHRCNFAISLYKSVKESGIQYVDFNKCLFISYLEDDYNDFYEFLIDNPKIFNDMIVEFSVNKNLDNYKDKEISGFKIDEKNTNVLVEGITSKYISFDYIYYFFKYPYNKKSYDMYELTLYHSIMFDEDSDMLKASLAKIDEKVIIEILNKRKNITTYPKIVFEYPTLLKIAYAYSSKTVYNTLNTMYDLISNYTGFKNMYFKLLRLNRKLYMEILKKYFEIKSDKILSLSLDEKIDLRIQLVTLLKKDSILFEYLFKNDVAIISDEEMRLIDDFNVIKKLTNYFKVDDTYISNIIKYINNSTKTSIIDYLKTISEVNNVSNEMFKKVFSSIDFKKYLLSDRDIKEIYNISKNKLELNKKEKLINFIFSINNYNEFLNNSLIDLLDSNDRDDVLKYKNVCGKFDYADNQSIDFIKKYKKYIILPERLLQKMYEEKHYSHYVVSNLMLNNKFVIEEDRFEVLKDTYLYIFMKLETWKYKVDEKMVDFLFSNVNFSEVPNDRIRVFEKHIQSLELIQSVISTNNHDIIKQYLNNIEKLNKKEEKDIFIEISNYYKKYGLDYKIRKKISNLTKNINLKNLLDGRKIKNLIN